MKKQPITILIIILIIVFGAIVFVKSQKTAPSISPTNPTQIPTANQTLPTTTSPTSETTMAKHVVKYTEDGFSPKSLTIKKGETVTWVNEDSDPMWVASDPHPIHNGYPTTGGCINSTFDSCKGLPKGSEWSFTFDKVGTWGYHNHLTPSNTGTIIVQ